MTYVIMIELIVFNLLLKDNLHILFISVSCIIITNNRGQIGEAEVYFYLKQMLQSLNVLEGNWYNFVPSIHIKKSSCQSARA